jgi:hypothetical protein
MQPAASPPAEEARAIRFQGLRPAAPGGPQRIQVNMTHLQPPTSLCVTGWRSSQVDAAIARDFAVLWRGMQQGRQLSELDLNLPLALYSGRQRLMAFLRRASFEELQNQVRAFAREAGCGAAGGTAGVGGGRTAQVDVRTPGPASREGGKRKREVTPGTAGPGEEGGSEALELSDG